MDCFQYIYTRCNEGMNLHSAGYDTAAQSSSIPAGLTDEGNIGAARLMNDALKENDAIYSLVTTKKGDYSCLTRIGLPTMLYGENEGKEGILFAHQLIAKSDDLFDENPDVFCAPAKADGQSAFRTEYNELAEGHILPEIAPIGTLNSKKLTDVLKDTDKYAFFGILDKVYEIISVSNKRLVIIFDNAESIKECSEAACEYAALIYRCIPKKFRSRLSFCSFWNDNSVKNFNLIFTYESAYKSDGNSSYIAVRPHEAAKKQINDRLFEAIWSAVHSAETREEQIKSLDTLISSMPEAASPEDFRAEAAIVILSRKSEPYTDEDFNIVFNYYKKGSKKSDSKCSKNLYTYYLTHSAGVSGDDIIRIIDSGLKPSKAVTDIKYVQTVRLFFPNAVFEPTEEQPKTVHLGSRAQNLHTDTFFETIKAAFLKGVNLEKTLCSATLFALNECADEELCKTILAAIPINDKYADAKNKTLSLALRIIIKKGEYQKDTLKSLYTVAAGTGMSQDVFCLNAAVVLLSENMYAEVIETKIALQGLSRDTLISMISADHTSKLRRTQIFAKYAEYCTGKNIIIPDKQIRQISNYWYNTHEKLTTPDAEINHRKYLNVLKDNLVRYLTARCGENPSSDEVISLMIVLSFDDCAPYRIVFRSWFDKQNLFDVLIAEEGKDQTPLAKALYNASKVLPEYTTAKNDNIKFACFYRDTIMCYGGELKEGNKIRMQNFIVQNSAAVFEKKPVYAGVFAEILYNIFAIKDSHLRSCLLRCTTGSTKLQKNQVKIKPSYSSRKNTLKLFVIVIIIFAVIALAVFFGPKLFEIIKNLANTK